MQPFNHNHNLLIIESFLKTATNFAVLSIDWVIKFCKVHHFADDTNLLSLSNSIKKLNELVNADLEQLVNWLNPNKISLNVKKTEMVIFKSKQKKFESDLKKDYVVKDYIPQKV